MLQLDALLDQAQAADACEVLIMAGDIPAMRINGDWQRCTQRRCSPADVEKLVRAVLPDGKNEVLWKMLLEDRELEFLHVVATGGRFPCNVHFQRGSLVLLVRLVDDSMIEAIW